MTNSRIAILGSGSMGGAILAGLLAAGHPPTSISVSTRTEASANRHRTEFGVQGVALEAQPDANRVAAAGASVVIVAVKPAYVVPTLAEIATALEPGALVVSVAAGVTTAAMAAVLPEGVRVVRAMPNTPAIVGRAVTGVAAGSAATREDMAAVEALFATVGRVVEVEERQIDALSTISGSGPAYVFYFIEQLAKAAEALGFTEQQAIELVADTFLGSAELLAASGKAPQELRRQVTSPNGTTERAIAVFDAADLEQTFAAATRAALARARELAGG